MKSKLTIKVIFIFFLIYLIGAVFQVFITVKNTSEALEDQVGDAQTHQADLIMTDIDRLLEGNLIGIKIISESAIIREYLSTGQFQTAARDRLVNLKNSTGDWYHIDVVKKDGDIILSTRENHEGENIFKENYTVGIEAFKKSIGGNVAYSDVFFEEDQNPTMLFSAPIKNKDNNEILGVIYGDIQWLSIKEEISANEWQTFLLKSDGTVLDQNNIETENILIGEKIPLNFIQNNQKSGWFYTKLNNTFKENHLASYSTEKEQGTYKGNKWILILSKPKTVVLASVMETTNKLIFLIIVFLFITLFATSYAVLNIIVKPINKLRKKMDSIIAGDWSQNIDIKSKDEIGDLAILFTTMFNNIKSARKDLENKIEEKTKNLSEQNKTLSGTKSAMLNLLEDLEEEKKSISEEKAKSEAILAGIGDGLVVTDEKGNIILMNEAAEKMLGWETNEVIGKSYVEILPLLNQDMKLIPPQERKINQVLKSGEKIITSLSTAHFYVRKDKSFFAVVVATTPIIIDKKIIGAVAIFRDVTHDKDIDRAKSEFVSLASHQLRTPLSTIGWYAEMLLSEDAGKINEDQKKFLGEIYRGNQRMVELVNALLNVSRLELGTFAVEPKPTNLIELAEDVTHELLPQIQAKKLDITSVCQKDGKTCPILPLINVDPKLMRIVFQNLVTNAVKYTPDGGKINFSISQKKDEILVKVSDTGMGIPKENQDKIFTKLFRADNARETDADGTGLGLYIVKAIVEQSGGKIWFESEQNKGTTFYITIPMTGMKEKIGTKKLD